MPPTRCFYILRVFLVGKLFVLIDALRPAYTTPAATCLAQSNTQGFLSLSGSSDTRKNKSRQTSIRRPRNKACTSYRTAFEGWRSSSPMAPLAHCCSISRTSFRPLSELRELDPTKVLHPRLGFLSEARSTMALDTATARTAIRLRTASLPLPVTRDTRQKHGTSYNTGRRSRRETRFSVLPSLSFQT